jgi:RNA polymerase subunit RPABC4/transcription elongation factor Spt4
MFRPAMALSEEAFTSIVDTHGANGCPDCGSKKVIVEALVAQKLPLLGGELYGSPSWAYKGEDLVRGTFRLACQGCERELFTETRCPECGDEDGVARALETENGFELPAKCAHCACELADATAFVPVVVVYEGKRAAKARTQTAPEDPGFHAFRVECKECRTVIARRSPCPLCR